MAESVYQCRDYGDGWLNFRGVQSMLDYHRETGSYCRVMTKSSYELEKKREKDDGPA